MNIKKLRELINKYDGQVRVCGDIDCNMMILELHEPEAFELLHKNYSTVAEGSTLSKKLTGYPSIRSLMKSDRYEPIPYKFAVAGDIGLVKSKQCTFLHLGESLLMIVQTEGDPEERFAVVGLDHIDPSRHTFFRRK